MGTDKALLEWRGQTLLARVQTLASSLLDPVRVIGREELPDRIPNLGPVGGIATALEASETDRNVILAVDLPGLTLEFLRLLRDRTAASPRPMVACALSSGYPLCLGVDRSLLPLVQERIAAGKLSVHGLIGSAGAELISEEELRLGGFPPSLFLNVNTPKDLAGE
jgi:molybdopterin-guanine dinucleotide biosynthesis protein A